MVREETAGNKEGEKKTKGGNKSWREGEVKVGGWWAC